MQIFIQQTPLTCSALQSWAKKVEVQIIPQWVLWQLHTRAQDQ